MKIGDWVQVVNDITDSLPHVIGEFGTIVGWSALLRITHPEIHERGWIVDFDHIDPIDGMRCDSVHLWESELKVSNEYRNLRRFV